MTTTLFDPPPVFALPVSWHADLTADFELFDPEDAALDPPVWTPLDYGDVVAYLDIKTEPPQRFTAEIFGAHAVVVIESEVCDELVTGVLWVLLLSYPGAPTNELPAMNGIIERHDGAPEE